MKIGPGGESHLTYCTNIHPGESWPEIRANLARFVPTVKAQVSPHEKFGIGLRLSAVAAKALSEPGALAEFQTFLADNGLYIFTLNGFPYGTFHGARVKEDVYLPDWRAEERLTYTNRLADLLVQLLPADVGLAGSISTVPGAFKPNAATPDAVQRIVALMLRHVAHLVQIRAASGRSIALALEPEPCCLLETIAETLAFFRDHLFSAQAVSRLRELTGLGESAALEALHRHLGVCLDLCHAAVEYEDPVLCLRQLHDAGINIAKLQITAGLRIPEVSEQTVAALRSFDDAVYLHQVVERSDAGLKRYVDLPQAFAALNGGRPEWRVHFHVPVFLDDLGAFGSTQAFVREVLTQHRSHTVSQHLEVETYTWGVLPERFRGDPVEVAIAREIDWVKEQLAA